MANPSRFSPLTFLDTARLLLVARFGSLARAAIAMGEHPAQLTHLFNGHKPCRRLRAKVAEVLGIPDRLPPRRLQPGGAR